MLGLLGWSLARYLYPPGSSEDMRKTIAYTKDLLDGLHIEKIQINLGMWYGYDPLKQKCLSFHCGCEILWKKHLGGRSFVSQT